MDFWTMLLISALTLIFVNYFKRNENWFDKHGIVHIKPVPFLGNMGSILFQRTSLMDYMMRIYNLNPDAKYAGFFEFSRPVIILRDVELVKTITVKYFDHFINHRGFADAEHEPLFGSNLFELNDEKWRDIRTLLSPSFTSSKMKGMFKLMSECAKNFANYLVEESEKKELEINSKDAFTRYANDVIGTCAFGITVDSMRNPNNEFYLLGKAATNFEGLLSLKFFLVRSFPSISKFFGVKLISDHTANFFIQLVKDTMATRDEKGITRPDMIQLLMETRNDKDGRKPKLTIEEMTAQAFVFFLGGFETTASLICFAAHEIAANPGIQERLQSEVDEVFEQHGEDVPYDAVDGMVYLDAVVTEALRMFPIASFLDRVCNKEFELPPPLPGGKPIILKPNDSLWVPLYPMQRDPKFFSNPDVFSPERFISNGKISTSAASHVLSFGLGPRKCIAYRFALLEIKIVLIHVLRKCLLKSSRKMIVPLEMSASSFAMTAKGGFWLRIQPRQN